MVVSCVFSVVGLFVVCCLLFVRCVWLVACCLLWGVWCLL